MSIYKDKVNKFNHSKIREMNKIIVQFRVGVETVVYQVNFDVIKAKRRRSQDKSVTKKSNQSQHLIMKKEFDNIA